MHRSEEVRGPVTVMQMPLVDYRRMSQTTDISELIMSQSISRAERFWQACAYGHYVLVRRLIQEGDVDVNCISSMHGCSPIHVAVQGNPQVVQLLIDAGCNVNAADPNENVALHHAAMSGDHEVVRILLSSGAQVNVNQQNRYGWSPLINACYYGHAECVRLLLDRGGDVHLRNKDGRTGLLELCRSRCTQRCPTVRARLPSASDDEEMNTAENCEKHTDTRKRVKRNVCSDNDQKRSRHSDSQPLNKETDLALIAVMLLDAGACVNERASSSTRTRESRDADADFTPLMFACYHSHYALAKVLLERGADVNACDENGWTALHWATERDSRDIVCLLLSYKCDPRLQDRRGQMALDRARSAQLRALLHSASQCSNGYVTTDDELEDGDDASENECEHSSGCHVTQSSVSTQSCSSSCAGSLKCASSSTNCHSPTRAHDADYTDSVEKMQCDGANAENHQDDTFN